MNDYEKATDAELNIEAVKRTHTLTIEERDNHTFWVVRHNKNGLMYISPALLHATIEAAWRYFDMNRLPKPATDANAALELFDFENIEHKTTALNAFYLASSPKETARVMTIAWLRYMDAKR